MAYLVIVCGYLFAITCAAYMFRKKTLSDAPPLRFALVMPAHNEAGQIESILDDAMRLDYPRERYGVFVIADNCTDNTAVLARDAGAIVFERHNPETRGKGAALDWFLSTCRKEAESFDAVAFVDADMRIDPVFLRELNAALACPDVQVVQASNSVAHPETNWRAALGYLGFCVINHVRPAGRNALGGTAELKGSGMAFRAPLLLRYGWPAHSLAEDVEFSRRLLLDDVLVHYNPDARVTSELATRRAQATVQQARWEGGRLDLFKRYFLVVLRRAITTRCWRFIDAAFDMLVPPLSMLLMLILAVGLLSLFAHPVLTGVAGLCAAAVAWCVFSGLILCRAPLRVWLYLASVPVFIAWKGALFLRLLLRRGPQAWQRTPRDRELGQNSRAQE